MTNLSSSVILIFTKNYSHDFAEEFKGCGGFTKSKFPAVTVVCVPLPFNGQSCGTRESIMGFVRE